MYYLEALLTVDRAVTWTPLAGKSKTTHNITKTALHSINNKQHYKDNVNVQRIHTQNKTNKTHPQKNENIRKKENK